MIIKILSSALCLALTLSVSSAQSSEQKKQTVQSSSSKAYIDPVTGELTSTPSKTVLDEEQAQATAAQQLLTEPKPEPEIIEHPDGMVEVVLNGHMDSQLNATVSCDGDIAKEHGESDGHVETDCDNNK